MSKFKKYWIQFPTEYIEEVRLAEKKLHQEGIYLDTGTGFGTRDWMIDIKINDMTPDEFIGYFKKTFPELVSKGEIIEV